MLLEGLPAYKGHMVINFSAQASSNSLQVRDGALGGAGKGGGREKGTGGCLAAGGAACRQGAHGHQLLGADLLQLAAGQGRGIRGRGEEEGALMCCLGNLADQLFCTQSSNHLKQLFTVEILARGKLK